MIMWRKLFILAVAAVVVIVTTNSAEAVLRHWYPFDEGRGATAVDMAGDADGTLMGTTGWVPGGVVLDGAAGSIVSLLTSATDAVNGIDIQSYSALTVELWATPNSAENTSFSTAVGFGKVNTTDAGLAAEYVLLQTHRGDDRSQAAISLSDDGSPWGEEDFATGPEHNDDMMHHYRAVITDRFIQLYVDDVLEGTSPVGAANGGNAIDNSLSGVSNEFAYVGDAYPNDETWAGTVWDLKIYDHAIPEPATLALLGLGALAFFGWRRRR